MSEVGLKTKNQGPEDLVESSTQDLSDSGVWNMTQDP